MSWLLFTAWSISLHVHVYVHMYMYTVGANTMAYAEPCVVRQIRTVQCTCTLYIVYVRIM